MYILLNWIAITQVCQRWRSVALGINELWTVITRDLSPKWIVAFLQRSSYAPAQIIIDISPRSPLRKPLIDSKRRPARQPLTELPSITIEEILSHTSHVESLHIMGKATDIIQTLMLLDGRGPLASLGVYLLRPPNYLHHDHRDESDQEYIPLILPDAFLGGGAPQLRTLHFHSGLHVAFPSWVLRALSEFTVSHTFDAMHLFAALRQMPQLEVLAIRPKRRYLFLSPISPPPGARALIHLNNLNLLVFVDSYLELVMAFLSCLSAPVSLRRHLKLTLGGYRQNHPLWERFSSLMCETIATVPDPPHGAHFRHEHHGTRVRIWATPSEQGLLRSSWPPLDDLYSLEIRYPGPGYRMPWNPTADYNASSFCHLQQFVAALGGSSVQELLIDCEMGLNITIVPQFSQLCWRALFTGFPSLRTLRFGVGATELLASASKAITTGPSFDEEEPHGDVLPSGLQRVIIDRGEFCTRVLWKWIHYAFKFVPPARVDYLDLRKDVLALLSKRRRGSVDIKPVDDATKALLIFLLRCGSRNDWVFKFALVECKWDEPDGLEILRLLLHSLDLDRDAILETTSSD
ncbi:hypothetical protein EDB92DRAFT_1108850 [Lactarius akahatsu]|uniref:F-box domain-containing protein n=1 Tax=Lactarius akahatsu TaxID=416441 RepID=A0AAD4Q6Y4_9AGAM|nr:hypothetical protein EDB92DRAFT_1108850 [Lactarius akahatsu]